MLTIEELRHLGADMSGRIAHLHEFLGIEALKAEFKELEDKMAAPDFWDNKESAQETVGKFSSCRATLDPFIQLEQNISGLTEAIEMAAEEPEFLPDAESDALRIQKELDKYEILSFLSGKFDRKNMYLTIHAGAGGTESCDWCSMLLRMFRRFIERRNWKDEVIDFQPGDEAGVKSVTLHVSGEFAYGYCKGENGVHRLVRISPFDSNARRHTSFCSVEIFPELDDDIDIEINESELRVDTYRSSGAGGQHVNTTDSAVRITHIPTGIVVNCQNERSQHKNRATAMKMLKAKLYEREEAARRAEADAKRDEREDNGWGSQIRSYVLQPYQMVKDLRTEVQTSDTAGVLDGDLDMFIEAWLKRR